jgi:RimJ/RimL family protein N-acetyltransferase
MGDNWELAVSVEKEHQNKGIAGKTMKYAISWAKTHGIETIFMYCISENRKIQHLAKKYGLKSFERDGPDITVGLKIPDATPLDYTNEWLREQQETLNQIIKLQNKLVKNIIPIIKG